MPDDIKKNADNLRKRGIKEFSNTLEVIVSLALERKVNKDQLIEVLESQIENLNMTEEEMQERDEFFKSFEFATFKRYEN